MAINHYLADQYDGGLKPTDAASAARALMWSFWGNNDVALDPFPRVQGWLDRLSERASLRKAWGGDLPSMRITDRRPLDEIDPRRGF